MARVNLEQVALTDPRFFDLGKRLHSPSSFAHETGIGVMSRVWNYLTERWSEEAGQAAYCIEVEAMSRLFFTLHDPKSGVSRGLLMAKSITESGLGEQTEFGLRICGTYGRIEWLNRRRQAARINGRKGGRKPTLENPPSPAPSLAPARDKRRSEVEAKSARASAPLGGANAHTRKAGGETEFGSEIVPDSVPLGKLTDEEWAASRPVYAEGFAELQRIAREKAQKDLDAAEAMKHVALVPELEVFEDPAETLRRLAGFEWPKPIEDAEP